MPGPGPTAWVSDGPADKLARRQLREQRRASMSPAERTRRAMCLVVLGLLLFISWAGHYFGPQAAVGAALVGVWVFIRRLRAERARRDVEDEAMAAAIRAARADEVRREL